MWFISCNQHDPFEGLYRGAEGITWEFLKNFPRIKGLDSDRAWPECPTKQPSCFPADAGERPVEGESHLPHSPPSTSLDV